MKTSKNSGGDSIMEIIHKTFCGIIIVLLVCLLIAVGKLLATVWLGG